MAYDPLTAGDLVAGKPTKEEIFTTIRANQEQFASDIASLQGTAKVDIFDIKFSGEIDQYSAAEVASFVPVYKAPTGAQMVSFVVTLLTASTSGTLEVEIDKSTDNGANWSALLNSPVELTGTTVGSISGSVDWVDVPSQSFAQNDLLRLRFTGVQVDQGEFHVSIYGEL